MKKTVLYIIFAGFFFIPSDVFSQNIDIEILKSVNINRNTSLDSFFILLTDSAPYIAYCVPLILLIFSAFRKNKALLQKSLAIIVAFALATIICNILKYSLQVPRPFETYSFIEKVSGGGSPSFPSGHTCDAFVIATALIFAFGKWYYTIPFLFWACLVGYSRMHLGVHYPSDVFGAALIGFGSSFLTFYFYKRMLKKENS